MNLVFNPVSQKLLERVRRHLPGSLLLTGEAGVGLTSAASYVADNSVAHIVYPMNAKEEKDKQGTIGVKAIRELYDKTRGKSLKKRTVIISHADRMSLGAQAAFLKLLEEPTEQTHYILTATSPPKLLPTIRSRVQQIAIQPITPQQTDELLAAKGVTDSKKQAQLHFIAAGLPAELYRLIENTSYFEKKAALVGDARDFLQADRYGKLLIIHKYRSDKEAAISLTEQILALLRRTLQAKPQAALIKQLEAVLQAKENIAANYSVPLQLATLVI